MKDFVKILKYARPYRKAMSPYDAKDVIVKGRGKDFDPEVVYPGVENPTKL